MPTHMQNINYYYYWSHETFCNLGWWYFIFNMTNFKHKISPVDCTCFSWKARKSLETPEKYGFTCQETARIESTYSRAKIYVTSKAYERARAGHHKAVSRDLCSFSHTSNMYIEARRLNANYLRQTWFTFQVARLTWFTYVLWIR